MDPRIMKDILTCCICLEIFRKPRMLPCCHTFCKQCLTDLPQRTSHRKRGFFCPLCQVFCQLGHDKSQQVLEELIALYRDKVGEEEVDRNDDTANEKCKSCKTEDGFWYCIGCQKKSCDDCHPEHVIHIPKGNDKDFTAFNFKGGTYPLRYALLFCKEHGGEPLKYFCTPCNQFVCSQCITVHTQNLKKDVFDVHLRNEQRVQEQCETEARSLACLDEDGEYIPEFTVIDNNNELKIDDEYFLKELDRQKKLEAESDCEDEKDELVSSEQNRDDGKCSDDEINEQSSCSIEPECSGKKLPNYRKLSDDEDEDDDYHKDKYSLMKSIRKGQHDSFNDKDEYRRGYVSVALDHGYHFDKDNSLHFLHRKVKLDIKEKSLSIEYTSRCGNCSKAKPTTGYAVNENLLQAVKEQFKMFCRHLGASFVNYELYFLGFVLLVVYLVALSLSISM